MTADSTQLIATDSAGETGRESKTRLVERVYGPCLAIATACLGVLAALVIPGPELSRISLAVSLVVAIVLLAGSELLVVPLRFSWGPGQISVGAISCLGIAIWLGPVTSGVLIAILTMIVNLFWHKRRVEIAIENSASAAMSAVVAGMLWWTLVPSEAIPLTSIRTSIVFLVAAIAYSSVNFGTVVIGTALARREPILQLALTMAGGRNFLFTVPVLAAFIPLIGSQSPIALLVFSFPLVSSHLALKALWRLESDTQVTLATMTDILEMRDTYTAFHSDRVALYAHAILLCLPSISARDAATIQRAARIHDIGKVAVRDAVLLKPGPLDQDERRAIESHSSIGADIIARMHAYRDCIDIIRHHHERWDGGGYPSRLVGDRIPIGARVIAVADSFDAMTTDRPYRQALSFETAVEEVRKNAGIQFDPDVARAFLVAVEDPAFQRPPKPMSGQVAAD